MIDFEISTYALMLSRSLIYTSIGALTELKSITKN